MVKFIPANSVLPLRSTELRGGLPESECVFPADLIEGAFHLGFFLDNQLRSVASFAPQPCEGMEEQGYQLRGMATDTAYQGRGFGKEIIAFAMEQLHATSARYLWCNARKNAVSFYERNGFNVISGEFEIEGIGPHYKMIIKLEHKYENN